MGDAKFRIGLNQSLVQHLLLFIGHIRNQEGEEDHQLLNLFRQHRVDVAIIQLVDQFHLRCEGGPDLHDIDAGAGAGGQFDVGTTDLVAGPLELMAFKRRQDIALNAAHS